MKRRVYRVLWRKRLRRWAFVCRQEPFGVDIHYATKATAIANGREWCRVDWREDGIPGQLVIHHKDGRIQTEHTYGRDPRRSRG